MQQLFTNIQDLMIQIKYLIILKNNYYLFVEIAYIYAYKNNWRTSIEIDCLVLKKGVLKFKA